MKLDWPERVGECKCPSCGGIYKLSLNSHMAKDYEALPFWFKADFRTHVFWAVNARHLAFLEEIIAAKHRERPVLGTDKTRSKFTTLMPFNLPSWLISSKNRDDLLHLIQTLKKREMA